MVINALYQSRWPHQSHTFGAHRKLGSTFYIYDLILIATARYIHLHLSFVFESCTHCLEMLAFEFHEWWCIIYSTFYCTHAMHLTLILAQMPTGLSQPAIFNTVQRKPTAQETLKRLFCEACPSVWLFLWRLLQFRESYQCFGQDTVVAIVGEPQGPAFLPRAPVQTCTAVARWRNSSWESGAGVHWRSNTQSKPGELQLWWKELRLVLSSALRELSQRVGSCV